MAVQFLIIVHWIHIVIAANAATDVIVAVYDNIDVLAVATRLKKNKNFKCIPCWHRK